MKGKLKQTETFRGRPVLRVSPWTKESKPISKTRLKWDDIP